MNDNKYSMIKVSLDKKAMNLATAIALATGTTAGIGGLSLYRDKAKAQQIASSMAPLLGGAAGGALGMLAAPELLNIDPTTARALGLLGGGLVGSLAGSSLGDRLGMIASM